MTVLKFRMLKRLQQPPHPGVGSYLKTVGEFVERATTQVVENKVLAPKEIAKLFVDPATGQPLSNGVAEKEENANITRQTQLHFTQ